MRNTKSWYLLMALVASIAAASAVVGPAGAKARPKACITRFYVDSTEDVSADGDEPYLKINTRFWSAPGSMDNGSRAVVDKTVHLGDKVRAYDEDSPDPDDLIGSDVIEPSLLGGTLVWESGHARYRASWKRGACSSAAATAARKAPACIDKLKVDRQEDFIGGDSPYLKVNTKFWEMNGVREGRWLTVYRTVHVGDDVQAWDADSPDPDDFIGSDKVGPGKHGTLVFVGDDARYRAVYHSGACV
jgi:hypothetical protein